MNDLELVKSGDSRDDCAKFFDQFRSEFRIVPGDFAIKRQTTLFDSSAQITTCCKLHGVPWIFSAAEYVDPSLKTTNNTGLCACLLKPVIFLAKSIELRATIAGIEESVAGFKYFDRDTLLS